MYKISPDSSDALVQKRHNSTVNSLWPCDAIWPHISGSTLNQVMACCLMAPSHYLNQQCHFILGVLWHSSESNFTRNARELNSLAPGKFEWNFRYVIFKQISVIDGWGISCEITLIRMSLDFTDDQPTLVQVMAWCCHATSHCLSLLTHISVTIWRH